MDLFVDLFRQKLFVGLAAQMIAILLILVRILSFMHFAPIFSHKSVPAHVRIGMTFFLTSMLAFKAETQIVPDEGYALFFAILANFALGFIMGFVANLLFTIVVASGEMMDASMGFSAAQIFDPSLGGQTTIVGKFMGILSAVVFFSIGGPEILIQNLANSFDTFNIYAPNLNINLARIIHLAGDIIRMGFVLVSPIVLTILVNDLVLGLLSRASPQINAFQISFTVKPCIGIMVWLLILPLFFTALANLFSNAARLF